jgi:hypothetical protein
MKPWGGILMLMLAAPLAAGGSRLVYDDSGFLAGVDLAGDSAFEREGVRVNDAAKDLLYDFAQKLGRDPDQTVTIYAYVDPGQRDNDDGDGRALAVKAALASLGFPQGSIGRVAGIRAEAGKKAGQVEIRLVKENLDDLEPPELLPAEEIEAPALTESFFQKIRRLLLGLRGPADAPRGSGPAEAGASAAAITGTAQAEP